MGQKTLGVFTKDQQAVIDFFQDTDYLTSNFYFTGGTALSVVYLNHRESEDLDFFSEKPYDKIQILDIVNQWNKSLSSKVLYQDKDRVQIFNLIFKDNSQLKLDFASYPYKRLHKGQNLGKIQVDSKLDIAVNKLLTTNQRTEIKDFVDLYFLLKEYTIWDLMSGVKAKFNLELDPLMIAGDFIKVKHIQILPKMLIPLDIKKLQESYIDLAIKLGAKVTE